MIISAQELAQIAGCSPMLAQRWLLPLSQAMVEFGIDAPNQRAAFVAQISAESLGFTSISENLNFRASHLVQIWPTRFFLAPEPSRGRLDATAFAGRVEAIANVVYADRFGNGGRQTEDGWRFRGRGLIPIRGRCNYRRASEPLALDLLSNRTFSLSPRSQRAPPVGSGERLTEISFHRAANWSHSSN